MRLEYNISRGVIWATAKTCSFLHERCNYSHVTSSNWTQPSFKLMLISYPSMCSDLFKSPCVQNDRTKSTRRAPVPYMGAFQGVWHINLHISPTTQCFCPISLAIICIYSKDSKTPKITQFGALAGQLQHVAAQKVGFTPRPIRYGPPNLRVSSSAALESTQQSWCRECFAACVVFLLFYFWQS